MIKKLLFIVFTFILCLPNYVYTHSNVTANETIADTSKTNGVDNSVLSNLDIDFYGSLRIRFGTIFWDPPKSEIANHLSRIGLTGKYIVIDGITAIARVELGINLVGQNPLFLEKGDPGMQVGQGDQVFTTRLGVLGFDTPVGRFTFGKQWSVYYDVAQMTDMFLTFGGIASGPFAVGDGGISGTGRAEKALVYRNKIWNFKIGGQAQMRNRNLNTNSFVATYGGALAYEILPGINIGGAYNEVLDGIDNPGLNQSKAGDIARVIGLSFEKGVIAIAFTYSSSNQHEVDNNGNYFNSVGYELWVKYQIIKRLSIMAGFNMLEPRGMPEDYLHNLRQFPIDIVYDFGQISDLNNKLLLMLGVRFDDSRTSEGEKLNRPIVYAGFNFGW